jgi:hypothetical protein
MFCPFTLLQKYLEKAKLIALKPYYYIIQLKLPLHYSFYRIPITRKKENAYKSALYLAASIVEAAFELEWLYQTYIRNTDRKPVISDRSVSSSNQDMLVGRRL